MPEPKLDQLPEETFKQIEIQQKSPIIADVVIERQPETTIEERPVTEQPEIVEENDSQKDIDSEESKEPVQESPPIEREAILYLDVNLGKGQSARIELYEGDNPTDVIESFGNEYKLNEKKRSKLLEVINYQLSQIKSKLPAIRENENEYAD